MSTTPSPDAPSTQLQLYGTNTSKCGYCGGSTGRASYGVVASSLSTSVYQHMLDRGWRRSGDYVYKPDIDDACCKQYTIRLDVQQFKPNKKQRQCRNRFNRYLSGESVQNGDVDDDKMHDAVSATKRTDSNATTTADASPYAAVEAVIKQALHELIDTDSTLQTLKSMVDTLEKQVKVYVNKRVKTPATEATVNLSTNAALMTYNTQHKHNSNTTSTIDDISAALTQLCNRHAGTTGTQFEHGTNGYINITAPAVQTQSARPRRPSVSTKSSSDKHHTPSKAAHTFTMAQHSSEYTDEAFALYKKYQIAVHHDPPNKITKSSYVNFLCHSPLSDDTKDTTDKPTVKFGSFHTHYRIDGKLIAVGVIDILPLCLSSVYVFYDTELSHALSLGTLTALLEIEYIRDTLLRQSSQLRYYYMGYYIHDCAKMKYKSQYEPTDILCLKRYTWHSIRDVEYALDQTKLVMFSDVGTGKYSHDGDDDERKYVYDASSVQQANKQQLKQCTQWIRQLWVKYHQHTFRLAQLPSLFSNQTFVSAVLEFLMRIDEFTAANVAILLD